VKDEKDFQKQMQKIGELVRQLEQIVNPAMRTSTKELVQLLMELHGSGLERALEIVFSSGDEGRRIIDDLGRDPLVSNLLILYGLHPEDLPARIERSLEQLRPRLHKMETEATLISTEDGNVRVRVSIEGHACGSTAKTVQSTIEEAIYEAAPDLATLKIEGLETPASGFIAMESLLAKLPRDTSLTASEGMD
jgi:Fe-S cluster biogenesis protein NfuA